MSVTRRSLPVFAQPLDPTLCRELTSSDRWASKTESSPSGCILWTGARTKHGYGSIVMNGLRRYAHRIAWVSHHGVDIPAGLVVDHICRTPSCVNPMHLEAVSQRENTMRGESPSAIKAQQDCCPKGHPYSDDNLVAAQVARGYRECRRCALDRGRARYAVLYAAQQAVGMNRPQYLATYGGTLAAARRILAQQAVAR